MTCWHKLFCERVGVSDGVSVFVLMQSVPCYFALVSPATEKNPVWQEKQS